MTRKRWLLLALAALAVPLPAFALGGSSAAGSLGVSVSNGGCGVAGTSVVCQLDVSFSAIDGARRYSAAVTAPDGSVVDYGDVGPGGASFWVPYVGDGTYSVSVSAWGPDARTGHPKPIATDSTGSATGHVANVHARVQPSSGTRAGVGRHADASVSRSSGSRASALGGASATVDSSGSGGDSQQQTCTPIPPAAPAPAPPPAPGDGSTTTTTTTTTPAPTTTTTPAPSCPDPRQTPTGGQCCPSGG